MSRGFKVVLQDWCSLVAALYLVSFSSLEFLGCDATNVKSFQDQAMGN